MKRKLKRENLNDADFQSGDKIPHETPYLNKYIVWYPWTLAINPTIPKKDPERWRPRKNGIGYYRRGLYNIVKEKYYLYEIGVTPPKGKDIFAVYYKFVRRKKDQKRSVFKLLLSDEVVASEANHIVKREGAIWFRRGFLNIHGHLMFSFIREYVRTNFNYAWRNRDPDSGVNRSVKKSQGFRISGYRCLMTDTESAGQLTKASSTDTSCQQQISALFKRSSSGLSSHSKQSDRSGNDGNDESHGNQSNNSANNAVRENSNKSANNAVRENSNKSANNAVTENSNKSANNAVRENSNKSANNAVRENSNKSANNAVRENSNKSATNAVTENSNQSANNAIREYSNKSDADVNENDYDANDNAPALIAVRNSSSSSSIIESSSCLHTPNESDTNEYPSTRDVLGTNYYFCPKEELIYIEPMFNDYANEPSRSEFNLQSSLNINSSVKSLKKEVKAIVEKEAKEANKETTKPDKKSCVPYNGDGRARCSVDSDIKEKKNNKNLRSDKKTPPLSASLIKDEKLNKTAAPKLPAINGRKTLRSTKEKLKKLFGAV